MANTGNVNVDNPLSLYKPVSEGASTLDEISETLKVIAEGGELKLPTPTATIDKNTGTPEVEVDIDKTNHISFSFKNLKGETGPAGESAGFGTISATVDSSTGTPKVTVTPSGTNAAKSFAFSFSGLKGEKGVDGTTLNEKQLDAINNITSSEALTIGNRASGSLSGIKSIAIGYNTNSNYGDTIAIGNMASASNGYNVAIGGNARAVGANNIVIGHNSMAIQENYRISYWPDRDLFSGTNSIVIGVKSNTRTNNSIILGSNSMIDPLNIDNTIRSSYQILIGNDLRCNGSGLLIGAGSTSNDGSISIKGGSSNNGIAIGTRAHAESWVGESYMSEEYNNFATNLNSGYETAIGSNANAYGESSIAIGTNSNVLGIGSIGIGTNSESGMTRSFSVIRPGNYCIAIGFGSTACENKSIAIGVGAEALESSISIGVSSCAYNENAIAIGNHARIMNSLEGIAIGTNANSDGGCYNAVVIGGHARAYNISGNSIAIGYNAQVSGANYGIAIGYNAQCYAANTIRLGDSGISAFYCAKTVTQSSDERDKTDIEEINNATEFLKKVKAIKYHRNPREYYLYNKEDLSEEDQKIREKYYMYEYDKEAHARGDKKGKRGMVGVIAQQTYQAMIDTYHDDNYANIVNDDLYDIEDKSSIPDGVESQLGVTYTSFIPFLIKSIQELDEIIQNQQKEINELKAKVGV